MVASKLVRSLKRNVQLAGLVVLLLPAVSQAQQYYDPGLLQKSVDRKPVDYQPAPTSLGGFILGAGAELAYEANDNIYYFGEDEESDSIIHVRPWASLGSDWNRHEVNLGFFADIGRYSDFGDEDYEDWTANLNGRVDVKRGSFFNYKASYMQLHEDRSSPDDVGGVKPTEFAFSGFDLGYSHTFNRLTAMLAYDMQDTDYDDNKDGDGNVLDNQDRDRSRDTYTLRLDYGYSEQSAVFVSYAANTLDYDQTVDSEGFERSSDGSDFRGGLAWNKAGIVSGDIYLQYVEQDYDDARFSKVDGFGIGASLEWTPTELTNISFKFANTPQETTQTNASGYYSSLYSVRVQHELRRNLLLNARVSYTDNDYETIDNDAAMLSKTEVVRAGVGVSYLFNRHFYISGGYTYERQDANTSDFEYRTNRWFITLGAEF